MSSVLKRCESTALAGGKWLPALCIKLAMLLLKGKAFGTMDEVLLDIALGLCIWLHLLVPG